MAYDAFMEIKEIPGESKAKDKAIDIYSFSWGASNPTTIASGGGGGGGKVSISSFNVMKKTEKSSPSLFLACCKGTHYPKIEVTLRKAGGEQIEYLKYTFSTVFVESVQWSGSSGGDDSPTESVSFAFGKVEMSYQPQDDTGKAAGDPQRAQWDLGAVTAE